MKREKPRNVFAYKQINDKSRATFITHKHMAYALQQTISND